LYGGERLIELFYPRPGRRPADPGDEAICWAMSSISSCGGGDRALPEVHGGSQEVEAVCSSMTVGRFDDGG